MMGNFIKRYKYRILTTSAALLCSVPFIIAAFRHSYVSGDDILTHMQRIEGMISSFRAGHIPARLHLGTLGGFAYGMGLFYPQLFLVVPAFLRILGINFILTTNGFWVLINILTGLSTFFCVFRITDSGKGALCGAAVSLFSYYRLADLFYRGSVGETTVFIFTPLLITGLYEIYTHKPKGKIWVIIGLTGILYSHLFSFLFTVILLALFLLFTAPVWIRDRDIRRDLISAGSISMLAGAGFWMPFLEQYLTAVVLAANGNALSPYRSAVPFQTTLSIIDYWRCGQTELLKDPVLLAYPAALLAFLFGKKNNWKLVSALLLTGSAGLVLSSTLFPWESFGSLHHLLQFPWRMMFLTVVSLPIALGISTGGLKNRAGNWLVPVIVVFYCLIAAVPVMDHIISGYILPSPGYRAIVNDVGAGDYLPEGADLQMIKELGRKIVSADEDHFSEIEYKESGLYGELIYQSNEPVDIEFPFLYYKGWTFRNDGDKAQPAVRGPHGLVQVRIPAAPNGTVRVFYQKTVWQWAGDFLSLFGIISFVYMCKKSMSGRKHEKRKE